MAYTIAAETRTITGRKTAELKQNKLTPAVVYGEGVKENLLLQLKQQELERIYDEAGESQVIELSVPEKKDPFNVLVKEMQGLCLDVRPQYEEEE